MPSSALNKAQASAAIEAAHAKIVRLLPKGVLDSVQGGGGSSSSSSSSSSFGMGLGVAMAEVGSIARTMKMVFDPELPPLLAPVPGVCRLIAFLIMAPIVVLCLTDFAGYAIFRTLGFRRRRVRVKRGGAQAAARRASAAETAAALGDANIHTPVSSTVDTSTTTTTTSVRAPLLTPGAYDADTLLRHRARSISGESVEAEEEWARTGGQFARVSNVRAAAQAAAATPMTPTGGVELSSLLSPPDSPRHAFARARNVGVEGALGYSDTDADDSGAESGRNSPEMGRRAWQRRGLTSSSFNFTPVLPPPSSQLSAAETADPLQTHTAVNSAAGKGLGVNLDNPADVGAQGSFDGAALSTSLADVSTSSWLSAAEGHDPPASTHENAMQAADLAP